MSAIDFDDEHAKRKDAIVDAQLARHMQGGQELLARLDTAMKGKTKWVFFYLDWSLIAEAKRALLVTDELRHSFTENLNAMAPNGPWAMCWTLTQSTVEQNALAILEAIGK